MNIIHETDDRYERLKSIKNLNLEKVHHSKVMVIGAGAVGNEVIKNLALFGVGNIFIYDFDTVEKSNLTRSILFREKDIKGNKFKALVAGKRTKEINPDCKVHAVNADICNDVGLGVFRRMDAIICCVDSRFARLMINRFCYLFNKSWINCGILDAEGICTVYKPGVNDYESELSTIAWANIAKRFGCPDVARQMLKEGSTPTTPITASIIGAIQVSEALKLIHGYDEQLLAGIEFRFNLRSNSFDLIECKEIIDESESHKRIQYVHETDLSCFSYISELKKEIDQYAEGSDYEILLRDPIITEVIRESDNKEFKIFVNESKLADYLDKKNIRDFSSGNLLNRIFIAKKTILIKSDQTNFNKKRLKNLGFPALDIIEVSIKNKGLYYFELTSDKQNFEFN
jgi:molybdopterin/thiamine biosynthesis adenylyltransferase